MPLPRQEGRASAVEITERQTSSLPPHICYHHRPRTGPATFITLPSHVNRASQVLRAGWHKAEASPPSHFVPSHFVSPTRAAKTSDASSAVPEPPRAFLALI